MRSFVTLWVPVMSLLGLLSCGGGEKRSVDTNSIFSDSLLSAPALDLESTAPPVFHALFSEKNYRSVLEFVDLSYLAIKDFDFKNGTRDYSEQEMAFLRRSLERTERDLVKQGWSVPISIPGKTGRDNQDADLTAIVSLHAGQRLIVVAFHGSRNGIVNPFKKDMQGDWGANYDADPVVPSAVGLNGLSDAIQIHRGLGNNLASAQVKLFEELDQRIQSLGPEQPIWIWTTGHSKGGAMAGLAAPLLKARYVADAKSSHVKVGAICFSSPKVFFGEASIKWVYHLVGQANIFRINVHGDPATLAPAPWVEGYRGMGVLFLDFIASVNLRTRQHYGHKSYGWLNQSELANYHYSTAERGFGVSFDPNVAMTYQNLIGGFEEGRFYLREQQR